MFLKTLKHFIILKLKELGNLLKWVGIVLGSLTVLLAPGQIVLRNADHFKFLGVLAKVDTQHPQIQLWMCGTVESLLFWLCAMLLFTAVYGIVGMVRDRKRFDYSRRFRQWCGYRSKELIASGIFLLSGFGFTCFSGISHSVIVSHWGIAVKLFAIIAHSAMVGFVIFVASCIVCGVINGVYKFFRNNWRAAKVLAEKECPEKYAN